MSLATTILGYITAAPLLLCALALILLENLGSEVLNSFGRTAEHGRRALDGWVKLICRLSLIPFGIRVRVTGRWRLQPDGVYIFMANHVNIFDPIVLYGHIKHTVRGVELEQHFDWPLWGTIIRRIGTIPISHRSVASALESLNRAAETLRGGVSILILPEGHRTRDGRLRPFMRGPFRLALDTRADIVPVALKGLYERNRAKTLRVLPGKIEIKFGDPIVYESFADRTPRELAERVRTAIEELL